jgi:hypothetical protein
LQRGARGLRSRQLIGATGMQLRRVDAAQPYLGVDVETGPHTNARFERIAVDDAQHFGRIDDVWIEPVRDRRIEGRRLFAARVGERCRDRHMGDGRRIAPAASPNANVMPAMTSALPRHGSARAAKGK